jgi:hypothetical protein
MPRPEPVAASLEGWLRTNGVPALVPRRDLMLIVFGPFLLVGFMLRSLVETLMRRGSAMLQIVPLLLVALTLSFFSTEVWQTIGRLHGLPLVLTALLFAGLAAAFATRQAPPDLAELARFTDAGDLHAALPARLADGPLAKLHLDVAPAPALRRRERVNLVVISVLAQVITAAVIALVVAAFFIVLGVLTVDNGALNSWLGHDPQIIVSWRLAGHEYVLTNELLRVSAFLGVFTGFYYIVSSTTDETMRADLVSGHRRHLRTCLAVRQAYWDVLRG